MPTLAHPFPVRYFSHVMSFVFWTAVAVCAIAQAFIIAGAVRAHRPSDADRALPATPRATEIAWTIVPAIGLALLLYFTHGAIDRAERSATHVQVPR